MKNTKLLIGIVVLSMIVPVSSIQSAKAVTWHSTVDVGDWMVYRTTLSANLFDIVHLSYSADITMNITDVNSTGVTIVVSDIAGTLSEFLEMMGFDLGNESFIPSEMMILPLEVLADENLTVGNESITFDIFTETDFAKYWRGIVVRQVNLAEIEGFAPFDFGDFIPGGNLTDFVMIAKWDNATGFLYEFFISIAGGIDIGGIILSFSIVLDMSMISASPEISDDIESRRDHSMDTVFFFNQLFSSIWFPVILFIIIVVVTFSITYYIGKQTKVKGREISTTASGKKKTADTRKGQHVAANHAEKYREKYKKI